MRIEQQNNILEALQQNSNIDGKGSSVLFKEKATAAKSKYSDSQSVLIKDSTYLNPALADKKELSEEVEGGMALDATARKNQMAVLSHTTSEEDYAKMQEEGFSLDATNGNTIVTVTDKIKMQIAKAGGDISAFGEDLSKEQIEALAGDAALASQIEKALKDADLPATEENVEECLKACVLGGATSPLTEGAMKYLLDNELKPTMENIYKANYSGGSIALQSGSGMNITDIQKQIENIIEKAGLSVNEETLADSKWLLANDIALTVKNISYLEDLKGFTGALGVDEMVSAVVEALAEGHMPYEAMMLSGYSDTSKAKEALSVVTNATDEDLSFLIHKGMELTVENLKFAAGSEKSDTDVLRDDLRFLTAKRQLEETRLAMSAEANYALLKKGISIDTKPLVELVEDLKKQENEYFTRLLEAEGVDATEENTAIFAETTEKLDAIKSVPAYVLGIPNADVSDINGVYEQGMALKTAMDRANQRYETLMTAPRKDMGDSYEKAFRNVDDILKDLGLETTTENQRAVRILAYNQLEITEEAIVEMKAADEEVQRTFKNLSPRVVLEMLRKGENPLNMDFSMLNKLAESIKQDIKDDNTERFSEYLWKLEKNHEITEEERSTYIGVYRLLHQVESTDGAAIGALIHQGSSLTLQNLLTAVRSSNKQKKMDITVDDSVGEAEQNEGYQNSITEQIMAGYQVNCVKDAKEALTPGKLSVIMKNNPEWMEMTPEQFAKALAETESADEGIQSEYAKEQLGQLEQCAKTSEEIYQMLERYDIPNSIQNILAMEAMTQNRNQFFKKLFEKNAASREASLEEFSAEEELEAIKQQIIEEFGEAVTSPEEMAKAQETLAKIAENVMKTMIDGEDVTTIDLKEVKLMRAQLNIQKKMAKDETYSIPVLVGDEVTNVTLKIVHGVEKRGMVDVLLESQLSGKIAATFQAKQDAISGTIATDSAETKASLLAGLTDVADMLRESQTEEVDLSVVQIADLDLNHFSVATKEVATNDSATDTTEQGNEDAKVGTARLYRIAESFIRVVKETYK